MRRTRSQCQALLRGGVVLLFVLTVVGLATAQTTPRRGRDWWHAPMGMSLAVNPTLIDFGEVDVGDFQIISLRKALKHERERFEEALRNQLGEG